MKQEQASEVEEEESESAEVSTDTENDDCSSDDGSDDFDGEGEMEEEEEEDADEQDDDDGGKSGNYSDSTSDINDDEVNRGLYLKKARYYKIAKKDCLVIHVHNKCPYCTSRILQHTLRTTDLYSNTCKRILGQLLDNKPTS